LFCLLLGQVSRIWRHFQAHCLARLLKGCDPWLPLLRFLRAAWRHFLLRHGTKAAGVAPGGRQAAGGQSAAKRREAAKPRGMQAAKAVCVFSYSWYGRNEGVRVEDVEYVLLRAENGSGCCSGNYPSPPHTYLLPSLPYLFYPAGGRALQGEDCWKVAGVTGGKLSPATGARCTRTRHRKRPST
jgi:hypothetical protein